MTGYMVKATSWTPPDAPFHHEDTKFRDFRDFCGNMTMRSACGGVEDSVEGRDRRSHVGHD